MNTHLRISIALSLLATGSAADVTIFEQTTGRAGNVVVLDETGIVPPIRPSQLQGIELLSIDFVGRTRLDELRPDKPRLRSDVPGASRVALPFELGSLYRYGRSDGGGTTFGYFVVDADGAARCLFELPGTGVAGDLDPIATRVAIDPAGSALLFGTTIAAGGNLIEVSLEGNAIDRTPTLGPFGFQAGGVTLLPDWGVAVTDSAVLRFDRGPGGTASALFFPGAVTPAYFEGSVAASAGGKRVALVAGSAPTGAHVWVVGITGSAQRVTMSPAHLSGAGFLPDHAAGPTLALSPDGATCAWREEGATRESFVKLVQSPNQAAYQITADARFADTLDDTGVLTFVSSSTLILFVGERGAPGTGEIEGGDFYELDMRGHVRHLFLPGGATAALSNLSGTSGDTQVPFLTKGEIDTDTGLLAIPGSTSILVPLEGPSGAGSLHRFDWRSGVFETVVDDVRAVELVQSAGSHLLLALRRDLPDDRRDLVRLPVAPGSVATILSSLPDGTDFDRCASISNGTVALVAELDGNEWSGRVHLPSATGALLSSQPRTYGPAQGFAPDGSLVTTIVLANGDSLFVRWSPTGSKTLLTAPTPGYLLPGV